MTRSRDHCCICGRNILSCHNPDPLRSGELNCCGDCNLLVRKTRLRLFRLPDEQRQYREDPLARMPLEELRRELADDPI